MANTEFKGIPVVLEATATSDQPPMCADLDSDCTEVENRVVCWMYAPEQGICPYLQGDK